jgi:hypothetical protein
MRFTRLTRKSMNEPETARRIVKHNFAPVGQKFWRLTLLEEFKRGPQIYWRCRCDCGNEVVTRRRSVRSARAKSCGCLHSETVARNNYRHGRARDYLYVCWHSMQQRCNNPKSQSYYLYGARGISICERWMMFQNFAADMGERPTPRHSLDRKDSEKGYSPENCRWATPKEQQQNTRRSIAKRARETGEALMAAYDHTRSKAKLNPAKTMAKLLAMRSDIGADTPAGHRISNIDEIRQNKAKAAGDPVQAAHLDASMARQLRDLEATRNRKAGE